MSSPSNRERRDSFQKDDVLLTLEKSMLTERNQVNSASKQYSNLSSVSISTTSAETSTNDDDEENYEIQCQMDDQTYTEMEKFAGDMSTAPMPSAFDHLTVLPRSSKMMNVCSENHRYAVELQKKLIKIHTDRKKAWSLIDQSQRDFIVKQVFEKHLHPFNSSRLESTEKTGNGTHREQQTNHGSTNAKQQRGKLRPNYTADDDTEQSSDKLSESFSSNNTHALNNVLTSKNQSDTIEKHSDGQADEECSRDQVSLPRNKLSNDETVHNEKKSRGPISSRVVTDAKKKPSIKPITVKNAKSSLAVCAANLQRTSTVRQHPITDSHKSMFIKSTTIRRRDIDELRKVKDSAGMFPTLTQLASKAPETVDKIDETSFHLPDIVERTPQGHVNVDSYADLFDILATSVCDQINKLKLHQHSSGIKQAESSRREMYDYRRQLLQRTRRQLVLN